MDLMGSDALQSEEDMRRMWGDSIKAIKSTHARITYDDFLLLMKGQTKEGTPSQDLDRELEVSVSALVSSTGRLHAVPEAAASYESPGSPKSPRTPARTLTLSSGDVVTFEGAIQPESGTDEISELPDFRTSSPHLPTESQSAPTTPAAHKRIMDIGLESPLSVDDEDITSSGPGVPGCAQSLTPPMSPTRGYEDFVTPGYEHRTMVDFKDLKDNGLMLPGLPQSASGLAKPPPYTRRRSQSLCDKDKEETSESRELHAVADVVRDMMLPESGILGSVDLDKLKSALVVNRTLYRAHRQMRLAVMEASKRFEEQQAEHARDVILAAREGDDDNDGNHGMIQAGLVMRHGHKKQVSSQAIRQLLDENRSQQLKLVEKANRRGGRGRRSRKKTTSDMSGMLNSMGQEDLKSIAQKAALDNRNEADLPPNDILYEDMVLPPPDDVDADDLTADGQMRGPTVPGEFRKTSDPFGMAGRYGVLTDTWK